MTSPAPWSSWLRRVTAATTAGGVMLLGAPVALGYVDVPGPPVRDGRNAAPKTPELTEPIALVSAGQHKRRRKIVHYTVRPGDTATGLAVRFHAWTAELLAINHLSARDTLYVGERIRIPVVRGAARRAKRQAAHHKPAHHKKAHHKKAPKKRSHPKRHAAPVWKHPDPSRATVRRIIVDTARRHGVPANLALAIAWQESGWQMHHVSSAHAIGAMQVIPSTGEWMSSVTGRRLNLYDVHDNVTAGVVLLKVLRQQTKPRLAVAAYYQGLGAVRSRGLYDDTKRYVANVLALRRLLRHGWNPA